MTLAASERDRLCALMDWLGPDAPTLCAGWTTRDLAAHLVVREGRLDATPGILLPPLSSYTARVQHSVAQQPFPELVNQVRANPPWWSVFSLPWLGDKINTMEFLVHHEDVRRARPGWEPRPADSRRAETLWGLLGWAAWLLYRNSPVGVVLRTPDGWQHTARQGQRCVAVVGAPEELVLHGFGRDQVMIEIEGDPMDVASFQRSQRRV